MDDALLLQKYHGLGNDYLVLDPNKNKIHLLERHIVKLCRRNIGAGPFRHRISQRELCSGAYEYKGDRKLKGSPDNGGS